MEHRNAAWLLRHRGAVAAAWLLLAAAAAWGMRGFRIDPDIAALFPKDDPTLLLTRHLQADAPPTRMVLLVVRGPSAEAIEAALPRVVTTLRESPHLERVEATREDLAGPRVAWFQRAPLAGLPDETLDRLKDRLVGPDRKAALESSRRKLEEDPLAGKETVLRDPLDLRWLFDEAGLRLASRFPKPLKADSRYLLFESPPLALVRAIGKDDSYRIDFSQALLADARARLAASLPPGLESELAGGYVSADAHSRAMRSDMLAQTVLSSALVFLFLAWYTRSVAVPFLLLFPVVLSIVCGLAFGGWIVGPLSPLVVSVAAILVAQPIDFSLHFFSRWRDERRGCAPEEAVLRSQDSLERPFVGAATATMAAFLLLLTSRFSGFVHLGLLLFLGMLVLLAASLSLFPVMLLGAGRLLRPRPESTPWAVSAAVRVAGSRGRVVGAAAIVLLGLGSWAAVALGGVRIDLDVRNMMAPGDPGQATLERLERDLGTSLNPVFAIVRDDADLRGRLEGLRAKGVIGFADGAHELFPSPERAGRNARFLKETEGWVDGARSDLAALGFRPEAFRESLDALQAGLAASPSRAWLQEPAFAALEARFFYQGERVLHLLPLRSLWKPDERAAFDAAVRASLGEGTRFFSAFHLPDHYAGLLGRDLARVAGWSAAAVILITLLTLGNVVDGLVALAPVVVATGATLLCCVFLGGAINLMNMVAIPIVLGTGVDGGIHFMARFRELGRRDPVRALTDTGPGVWGSAVTTLLGFGAIGGSRTPGLSSMGMLVTAGTAVVLAATFFLLPVLAGTMSKHKDTK